MKKRVILLPGMHRSGTSATARVLNLLGCEIPGPLVPAFHGNDFGHWEPQPVVDLHDAFLKAAGVNVNSVFGVEPTWFSSPESQRQVDATVDLLERHLSGAPLHVIKDPRMGFFIPIWRRALDRMGVEATFVLPFRDPAEVAASLTRRQTYVYPDAVWPPGRGILLWLRYVLVAERETRGTTRAFLAYDALLNDWRAETQRIGDQLQLAWPQPQDAAALEIDAFLSRELKHESVAWRDEFPLAYEVFDQMKMCTKAPRFGEDVFSSALDAISQAGLLFEPYVAELELRLGANPTLRTEFVDFVRRTNAGNESRTDRSKPDEEPGDTEVASDEHDKSFSIRLQAENRVLASQKLELEAFNAALLGAARHAETSHLLDLREAVAGRKQAEQTVESVTASLDVAREATSAAEARILKIVAEAELAGCEELARREQLQGEIFSLREALGQAKDTLLARSEELDAMKRKFDSQRPDRWLGRTTRWFSKKSRVNERDTGEAMH